MSLKDNSADSLKNLEQQLLSEYQQLKSADLSLDLTRGKPSAEQLGLSDTLDGILEGNYQAADGDTRNYGGLEGIIQARQLGAAMLGTPVENTIAEGNSSLSLMHMVQLNAYLYAAHDGAPAWKDLSAPKMLCPVPGYDRHFSITESFGIKMINVPMNEHGPDMDIVEQLIRDDQDIIGMWCVPKYSNPSGVVYSNDTVDRIAALGKIANSGFRVMWDNAYSVHDLVDDAPQLANIWERCEAHGTQDSVWQFASTSKITYAGGGVSFASASRTNLEHFEKLLSVTTIGADKVNQLRTVKLLPDMTAMQTHMQKHATLLKPKFDIVLTQLGKQLGNDFGRWTKPQGGYFVSLDIQPGLAKQVVSLCGDAGVKVTAAGAPFPYGLDPEDSNIRIAPSFPPLHELEQAMKVLICCIKLATVQQKLA